VRGLAAARRLQWQRALKEIPVKNIIMSSLLSLVVATGCNKSSDCEKVLDHTLSLMPPEFKQKMESGRADALAKCEKMSPEARKCALDASSMEDLMKCPRQ
jgi:hypothetical protein